MRNEYGELARKALEHAQGGGEAPDLDSMIQRKIDALADRFRNADTAVKGIEDDGSADDPEIIESEAEAQIEGVRKGIEAGELVSAYTRLPSGEMVHMDDLTERTMEQFADRMADSVNKALEPVAKALEGILAFSKDARDLGILANMQVAKALGDTRFPGISASAVANFGRPGPQPSAPRREPVVTTGTQMQRGPGGNGNSSGVFAKLAAVQRPDRERRVNKAIEADEIMPGRARVIDNVLAQAAQITDPAERDRFVEERLTPADIAAVTGGAQ